MLLAFLVELAAFAVAMQAVLLRSTGGLWNSYCNQLRKRPLLTKAATGGQSTIWNLGMLVQPGCRMYARAC